MLIQWYPGHMAKARRQLTESLKLIDVVVEIVDARAPRATRNPDFDGLFKDKKRVWSAAEQERSGFSRACYTNNARMSTIYSSCNRKLRKTSFPRRLE